MSLLGDITSGLGSVTGSVTHVRPSHHGRSIKYIRHYHAGPAARTVGRVYAHAVAHERWQAHRNAVVAKHKRERAARARHAREQAFVRRYQTRALRLIERNVGAAGRAVIRPNLPTPKPVPHTTNLYTLLGRSTAGAIHQAAYGHPIAEKVGKGLVGPAVSASGESVGQIKGKSFWNTPLGQLTRLNPVIGGARGIIDAEHAAKQALHGDPLQGINVLTAGSLGPELSGVKAVGPAGAKASSLIYKPLHLTGGKAGKAAGSRGGATILGFLTGGPVGAAAAQFKPVRKILANTVKDAFDLPAEAIPSAYYSLTTDPSEQLKQFKRNDPIGRLLFHGDFRGIERHPLIAALEVAGGKGAIGRGLGRGLRIAPKGTALERLSSRDRAPAVLPNTRLAEIRRFSPDVVTKGRQVAVERYAVRRATSLRREAATHDRAGNVKRAGELRQKANRIDPRVVGHKEIQRRIDERVAANEDVRRIERSQAMAVGQQAIPRRGGPAVPLIAQGIVKASRVDLIRYQRELYAEFEQGRRTGSMSPAQLAANENLRKQLAEVIGSKRVDYHRLEQAAREYARTIRPLERKLVDSGMLDAAQAEHARLRPYAVRHMRARYVEGRGLLDPKGNVVSPARIRAHMAAHGVNPNEIAYITHEPGSRGARNFFRFWNPRVGMPPRLRTGEAVRLGTLDAHPDTLIEQAARTQGLVSADTGFKRFTEEFGIRNARGELIATDYRTAARMARDAATRDGRTLRPIRLNPWRGKEEQLNALLDEGNAPDHDAALTAQHQVVTKAIEDAISGEPGEGVYGLVDEAAARRLQAHQRLLGGGTGGKTWQLVNSLFRQTVLSTSPKWLTGNVAEAGVRTALVKAGPRSYYVGRVLRGNMSLEAIERTAAGGHYSYAERQHIRRPIEQVFEDSPKIAKALGTFARSPGPKQIAALWRRWTQLMFNDINSRIERQFQTAMLGRYAREHLMGDQILKVGPKAIQQALDGLTSTNEQVALGRYIDRAYGQYSKFSPGQRRMIALYTPFVAWTLNATKFVFSVLPKDHPVTTALLASSNAVSEEWRHKHGLDLWIDKAAPGWLQGSIPVKGGSQRGPARYTPFGAFSQPFDTWASAVLPQFRDTLNAMQGRDWKGDKMNGPYGGELDPAQIALNSTIAFLGSTIPLLGQGMSLGGVSGIGSQAKRKTTPPFWQRLRRTYDPFYPVTGTKSSAKNKSSTGSTGKPQPWPSSGGKTPKAWP